MLCSFLVPYLENCFWMPLKSQGKIHWRNEVEKYTIKVEIDHQPRLDVWDKCSGLCARGMGWGGRWEGGSGWGTHVNPWLIHVNVWQKPLQYCKVISLHLIKINKKKKRKEMKLKWQWGKNLGHYSIVIWVAVFFEQKFVTISGPLHLLLMMLLIKT